MEELQDSIRAVGPAKEAKTSVTKKRNKRRGKKKDINRYVLESDSESDREFLEAKAGKEDSSGESDVQSADEEDALAQMYGPESQYVKKIEAKRRKNLEAIEKKNARKFFHRTICWPKRNLADFDLVCFFRGAGRLSAAASGSIHWDFSALLPWALFFCFFVCSYLDFWVI